MYVNISAFYIKQAVLKDMLAVRQTDSMVGHCSEQAMSLMRCKTVYLCLLFIFFSPSINQIYSLCKTEFFFGSYP